MKITDFTDFTGRTLLLLFCVSASCSPKGGGSSGSKSPSSGSRGPPSSSGSRAPGSWPGKPHHSIPKRPNWTSRPKHSNGLGRSSIPVAAGVLGLWLGYQTSEAINDVVDWTRTCESCLDIRGGVQHCANVNVPYATSSNQILNIAGDPLIELDCLCGKLNPVIYDECLRCAPASVLKDSVTNLQNSCVNAFLDEDTPSKSDRSTGGMQLTLLSSAVLFSLLAA